MLSYLVDLTGRLMGALRDEEGQGLAEYALILAFIAVVAIAALTFLGTDISNLLSNVATKL
jgi:pilus assembly protein Flp/PilA